MLRKLVRPLVLNSATPRTRSTSARMVHCSLLLPPSATQRPPLVVVHVPETTVKALMGGRGGGDGGGGGGDGGDGGDGGGDGGGGGGVVQTRKPDR